MNTVCFGFLSAVLFFCLLQVAESTAIVANKEKQGCLNLSINRGNVSLLAVLQPRKFSKTYSKRKNMRSNEGSGHKIFYRLVREAGFVADLSNPSARATLFIPNDLSVMTSAKDLKLLYGIKASIRTYAEAETFLVQTFPSLFSDRKAILKEIAGNHLAKAPYNFCDLFQQQKWRTWAKQNVTRSGIRLYTENKNLIPAQIDISKLPIQAGSSVVYAIDRLMIPRFNNAFLRSTDEIIF